MRDEERELPLKPDVFAILLILCEGDAYGYRLMQEAAKRSDGRIELQAGALYRRLRELLDAGLIEELDTREVEDAGGERRRYYGITAWGRRVARAEAQRMETLVRAARAISLLPARRS